MKCVRNLLYKIKYRLSVMHGHEGAYLSFHFNHIFKAYLNTPLRLPINYRELIESHIVYLNCMILTKVFLTACFYAEEAWTGEMSLINLNQIDAPGVCVIDLYRVWGGRRPRGRVPRTRGSWAISLEHVWNLGSLIGHFLNFEDAILVFSASSPSWIRNLELALNSYRFS